MAISFKPQNKTAHGGAGRDYNMHHCIWEVTGGMISTPG